MPTKGDYLYPSRFRVPIHEGGPERIYIFETKQAKIRPVTLSYRYRFRFLGEAGTGIEPVNSGFADRGLTTWLPRRILLPEPIRWLFTVSYLSLVASCCQLSGTKRMSANVRPAIAHRPVQRKQAVQVLFGWLQSQWQAKAALFQGRRRRQSETRGACQAAKKRGSRRARIPLDLRVLAAKAARRLAPFNKSVLDAAEFYASHLERESTRSTCLMRLRIT